MALYDFTKPKKFKSQKLAGKIMATVFWDAQGLLLVNFPTKGKKMNSEPYIKTFKKVRARIRRARPQLEMKKVFLQHVNNRPTQASKQGKQSLLLSEQLYRILHILLI